MEVIEQKKTNAKYRRLGQAFNDKTRFESSLNQIKSGNFVSGDRMGQWTWWWMRQ